jgi:hypothetical protein
VSQHHQTPGSNPEHDAAPQFELSSDDQRIVDDLIEAGFDLDAMEPLTDAERARAERLLRLLGLMRDYPVDDADDTLLHATMVRIDRYEHEQAQRMAINTETNTASRSWAAGLNIRSLDFISVAAVLLIAASVLWPMLASVRQHSIDRACANNMRLVGYGLSHYAGDNNGAMPVAKAGFFQNASWDTVPNVLNLAPLVEGQYCQLGHLNCAGNHDHLSSTYSYQWQMPGERMMWGTGRITIVLGDRNPLIDAARAGRTLPANTMSRDHRGRGQNVLASDGATLWLTDTIVGTRDNIWLPHGADKLSHGARPADTSDVMLAH